jgi:hypothetical protein
MIEKSLEYVKLYTETSIKLINNEKEIISTLEKPKGLKLIKEIVNFEKNRKTSTPTPPSNP